MKNKPQIKIGFSTIMLPNAIGEIVRETPKQIIVNITKRTFESKSSSTFTHNFTDSEKEWFKDKRLGEIRFWKNTLCEVGGGKAFIIKK